MCFEFGSCFGNGRREDYGGERPARKEPHSRGRRGNRRHDEYYGGVGDHKAPPAAYHNQPHAVAVDEVGHKAYQNGGRKDHHADAGGHGRYAAYVQDKAVNGNEKFPAWHNKVGDDAGHTYTYTAGGARLPEAAADHRENTALDYHHYPTTTTSTTFLRY